MISKYVPVKEAYERLEEIVRLDDDEDPGEYRECHACEGTGISKSRYLKKGTPCLICNGIGRLKRTGGKNDMD